MLRRYWMENDAQQPGNQAQLGGLQPQANIADLLFGSTGAAPDGPVTCAICKEDYPRKDICCLLCRHWHCKDCFTGNFRIALKSNPFVPAKCCGVIPSDLLSQFGALTANEVEQYKVKMEELTNPRSKLYCWGCAAYIPNDRRTRKVGDCGLCGKRTCKACRAKSHFGACDKTKIQTDIEAEDEVYLLAESKGWKRCPNCLNLVQKNGGCNHMTCNCGQDFCYLCGQVYGSGPHTCEQEQLILQQRQQRQQRRRHQREQQLPLQRQQQLPLQQQQQLPLQRQQQLLLQRQQQLLLQRQQQLPLQRQQQPPQ
ncbi:hypothetical protein F4801DRAFT_390356 [Xylaria longipes]|nr:hypothetical protein F4801DRAFT_390356 [Xylaria longipes]